MDFNPIVEHRLKRSAPCLAARQSYHVTHRDMVAEMRVHIVEGHAQVIRYQARQFRESCGFIAVAVFSVGIGREREFRRSLEA